jgi:capsular exopolysaccharide synthesis family protein
MLDRQSRGVPPASAPFEPQPAEFEIGLPQLLAFLNRQRWPIVLSVLGCLALAAAYLALTPPSYTASSVLLIDPRKVAIFEQGNVLQDASISNSAIETQVQVLKSGRIARAAAEQLKLADDADFMHPPAGLLATAKGWARQLKAKVFGSSAAPAKAAPDAPSPVDIAAAILASSMSATRVGLSYAINVSYTSRDPDQAARLANGISQAYLDDQIKTQVSTAQRASDWLQSRIADLQAKSADAALSAQEKSAIRATYDSFLARYTETVQQQSLPFADAQVLTAAVAPSSPASPKPLLAVAAAIIAGGILGFGIGLGRELLDRGVRTRRQVEAATGAPYLGALPTFDMKGRSMRRVAKRSRKLLDTEALRFSAGPAYSVTLTAPLSRYAETLRGVKIAAEGATGNAVGVLGVVSALPNEGRSTVAINLARMIAQSGRRPILIDGDMRNPTLSRELVPANAPGLADVVSGHARISEVVWTDQAVPLQFVPAGSGKTPLNDALGASATRAVINACRQQYDIVIVDLPAVLPVVDVRAAAHLFDAFLFVVEWGYVTEDMLARAVQASGAEDKILGTVLNKCNLRLMQRFETASPAGSAADEYLKQYSHIR